MATGRDLLGVQPRKRFRVWVWNGEDPVDELRRRILAICLHYKIDTAELEGWLYIDSGRQTEIVLAVQGKAGVVVNSDVINDVKDTIIQEKIEVVVFDPFVSTHQVPENDNTGIDLVVKTCARIADATGCAFEIVHHARKTNGEKVTAEDGRGASAVNAAARSVRVLNAMTEAEATKVGVEVEERRRYVRAENGKSNLSAPSARADWYRIVSVSLDNGGQGEPSDEVGVFTTWTWPNAHDGITKADLAAAQAALANGRWRENAQAEQWVGKPIAAALNLNLNLPAHAAKVKQLVKDWIASGALVLVEGKDEKRVKRTFVEVGRPANVAPPCSGVALQGDAVGKSTLPHHPLIGVWGGVRQGEAGVAERDSFDLDLEGLCLGPTDPSEFGFES